MAGEFEVKFKNPHVSFILPSLVLERRVANEKFVTEDSETPQINFLIVSLSLDHLWRQVIQCSTEGGTSGKKSTTMFFQQNELACVNVISRQYILRFYKNSGKIKRQIAETFHLEEGA